MDEQEKRRKDDLSQLEPLSFEEELDQYDLLSEESEDVPETNLSATARAFNTRIQRKKQEQERVANELQEATRQRHQLILHAMMKIRKSLRDVTKIDLGNRFHFEMIKDDWQGWPRMSIQLRDTLLPDKAYPSLQVTANDRHQKGSIEMISGDSEAADSLSLLCSKDLQRLPAVLKRCVRNYLDLIGDIVLAAERLNETLSPQDGEISSNSFEAVVESEEEGSLVGDVFQDEDEFAGDLDVLQPLDDVDSLPEL